MRCRLQLFETITESDPVQSVLTRMRAEHLRATCRVYRLPRFEQYLLFGGTCHHGCCCGCRYLPPSTTATGRHIELENEKTGSVFRSSAGRMHMCVYVFACGSTIHTPPARVTLQQHCTLSVLSIRAPYTYTIRASFLVYFSTRFARLSLSLVGSPSFISSVRAMCAFFVVCFHLSASHTHIHISTCEIHV